MSVKRNLSLLGIVLVMLFFQLSSHGDGEESRWVQGLNVNPKPSSKLDEKKDDAAADLEKLFENKIHPKRKQGKSTKYSDNPEKKRDGASKGGDSQMMLQKVVEEKGKAVALVVAYVDIKGEDGKVIHREGSFGTAWAFAPDKFATNAHVADAIKKHLDLLIGVEAKTRVDAELKAAGINKVDFSELGARELKRLKGEFVVEMKKQVSSDISTLHKFFLRDQIQALMQKSGISDETSFMNALLNELGIYPKDGATPIVDMLFESKLSEICRKLQCSDLKELQIKLGKEEYFEKISGCMKKVYGGLQDYGAMVRINGGNGLSYKIKEYQKHSQYNGPFGYDVAVLTIDGNHDVYFELADEKVLRELKQGEPIAYLGFPMERLIGDNHDLDKPIATMQNGIVSKVCDYTFKDSGFANNVLIVTNVPGTGGASGSPLFNHYGKVVGLFNAGNTHEGIVIASGTVLNRIPNAALVNYGQRVDLLHGKLSSPVSVAGLLQKNLEEAQRVSKEQD